MDVIEDPANQSLYVVEIPTLPNQTCPDPGTYPTIEEFYTGLGVWASVLYVTSAVVVVILALEYGFLIGKFNRHVPNQRKVATLWINSVYLVVAVFTLFSIYLPKASVFVWLFYRVYLGIAMRFFVSLTMAWYQGEAGMVDTVGPEMLINFRVFPCCCCLCCSGADYLTKRKIKIMKGAVFQMPYVQGGVLFFMAVLNQAGHLEYGNLSLDKPYIYFVTIIAVSFCLGIWGMFVFIDIAKRNQLLTGYQYRKKSALLKSILVLINIQGLIVDICAKYGAVDCIPPYLSVMAVGGIIKSVLCLVESLVLGTLAYCLYFADSSHV